jgi:predicted alpha/beta superfamily hydrolase
MKYRQLLFIFALSFVPFLSHSGEPFVIGETLTIDSKVLKKQASINITLPSSYQALTNKRYPVYYNLGTDNGYAATVGTLQALSHNQEYPMPEAILVSLTTDTAVRIIERGVKSEDFINFLAIDVIPYIDKHYRSQPFRILSSGERFGMAPLYGLIHKPELFQAYITISPWITDESGLLSDFEAFLKKNKNIAAFLWLSSGDGLQEVSNYHKLTSLLQQHAPQTLDWKSAEFNQNTNMSQSLLSLPTGLEALFADMYLTPDSPVVQAGAKSIKSYYQQLSQSKYGYAVSAERAISALGYAMLKDKKVKEAIAVFKINLQDFPDSPHVYAAMAWGFKRDGDWAAALPMQKTAYELALKQNSEYKDFYKRLFTEIENKLSAK